MNVSELKMKLNERGVSDDLYSIMTGGLPNEKLCIIKDNNWQVYYSERGNKIVLKEFESEHEACEYFYKRLCHNKQLINSHETIPNVV